MNKFRVTYVGVKIKEKREGSSLVDSQIAFREEKTVYVEAENEQEAIKTATSHLPKDVDVNAQVSRA